MSHHQKIQKQAEKKALAWYRSLPPSTKSHLAKACKLTEASNIKRHWLRNVATPQEISSIFNQGH
jgi:hypothetical protein